MEYLILFVWLACTGMVAFLMLGEFPVPGEGKADKVFKWFAVWAVVQCVAAVIIIVWIFKVLDYALRHASTQLPNEQHELGELDRQIALFKGINQAKSDDEITHIMESLRRR